MPHVYVGYNWSKAWPLGRMAHRAATLGIAENFVDGQMVGHPRQNRVNPLGIIEAASAKGTLMGNRGDLHAPDGSLGAKWRVRRWIACTLEGSNGKRVAFDSPGRYYPLFFTDEAVALAAGHRPCAQCRRDAFSGFLECWRLARGVPSSAKLATHDVDRALHSARIDGIGRQVTFRAELGSLPDGAFVTLEGAPETPLLLWRGRLHPWTRAGYRASTGLAPHVLANVITPAPTVEVLRAGYTPSVCVPALN